MTFYALCEDGWEHLAMPLAPHELMSIFNVLGRFLPSSDPVTNAQQRTSVEMMIERLAADKALLGQLMLAGFIALFSVIGHSIVSFRGRHTRISSRPTIRACASSTISPGQGCGAA